MEVRDLRSQDLEGVYALRLHRYDEIETDPTYGMSTRASPPSLAEFTRWFEDLQGSVERGTGVGCVALEEGRIVGLARIGREDEALETRHVGVLSIEVLPESRGRGVGSALLGHALDACRGRFEVVKLEVLPGNAAGLRLYRKFGFEEYGRLPRGFYRAGAYHDFILMHRAIPKVSEGSAR